MNLTFIIGVIPRAVREIFETIKRLQEEANSCGKPAPTFEIHVQFLEVWYISYLYSHCNLQYYWLLRMTINTIQLCILLFKLNFATKPFYTQSCSKPIIIHEGFKEGIRIATKVYIRLVIAHYQLPASTFNACVYC